MIKNKINTPYILGLLATYRVMVSTIPAFGESSSTIINFATLLLTYLAIFYYFGIDKSVRTALMFLPLFIIGIADSIFGYSGVKDNIVVMMYGLLQDLLWPLLVMCVISKNYHSLGKYLLILLLVCFFITSITTYIQNLEIPGASRALARLNYEGEYEMESLYKSLNIGGVDFIYQLVLMMPLLVFTFRKGNRMLRILSLLTMVVFAMAIIVSEYTTALIFAFASVLLFFFPENTSGKRLLGVLFGISFVLLFALYVVDIFGVLATIFGEKTEVAEKLQDISNHIHGMGYGEGDYDVRIGKWTTSLEAFASSPLYGTSRVGGGHSYLLDHLARYGIIGVVMLIIVFKNMFKLSVRKFNHTSFHSTIMFLFFVELGLTLLNPYIHLIIFTLVVPLFAYVLKPQPFIPKINNV